ncbi:glycosyltransferase [Bradyrhizobium sp. CCBAU 53415]|uniref:glycosyltransferase n=1 Tax=Bradyrhizobium sp. CCBAU 53415 TaxID=1325119 RepID=UPI002306893A|nr:glycosyltransferase [Bradyrhizobium sp. CCBAU 53415]MDA9464507.1 hypothetical protein [Bradyrhizobium sp. CCBAU 53415]
MLLFFWLSAICAVYSYSGYPIILWFARHLVAVNDDLKGRIEQRAAANSASFTMIVAAYNEGPHIRRKIESTRDALEKNPDNELIVVSDHSTDDTVAASERLRHPQVRVLENEGRRGRAGAHNYAIRYAKNEFVIFSDVETRVPAETILKMVDILALPGIGCVNAEIVFENEGDDKVSDAAGIYWRFEMWLRTCETLLGLYATSSGPCMGIRRSLFKDLPATGDVDFTTPLDVINAGYFCAHLNGHVAYDVMPPNADGEFKARVRMVAKNFSGTISRWGAENIIKRPVYTWALYSHKIFRWLTPFFLLAALTSNLIVLDQGWFYQATLCVQGAFYGMAALGAVAYRKRRRWPVVQQIFGFVLVNIAFAIGVLKAIVGNVPAFYNPTRLQAKG